MSDRIVGVLFALQALAQQVGLVATLGQTRLAKLALFLVLARVAHQGSRLSAVLWAANHAVSKILDLTTFDEDDLYAALDWLAAQQEAIVWGITAWCKPQARRPSPSKGCDILRR